MKFYKGLTLKTIFPPIIMVSWRMGPWKISCLSPKVPFSTSKSHKFWVSCHEAHHLNSHDLPWFTAWLHSLKLTAGLPLKMDGWKMNFLLGQTAFFQVRTFFLSGRVGLKKIFPHLTVFSIDYSSFHNPWVSWKMSLIVEEPILHWTMMGGRVTTWIRRINGKK